MGRPRWLLAGLCLLATLAVVIAPGASAAAADKVEAPNPVSVRLIDATNRNQVKVAFGYTGDPAGLSKVSVKEDGKDVKAGGAKKLGAGGVSSAVSIVVDLSTSFGDAAAIRGVQAEVAKLVDSLEDGTKIAIVAYADSAKVVLPLTDDKALARRAVFEIGQTRGSQAVLWDGLAAGLRQLDDLSDTVTSLVVVSNGVDTGSSVDASRVSAELAQTKAAAFVVGVGGDKAVDQSGLAALATESGGSVIAVNKATDAPKGLAQVQGTLTNQYVVSYASDGQAGQNDLSLTVGKDTADAAYVSGGVANGYRETAAVTTHEPARFAFLHSSVAMYLALAAITVGLGLGAYGIAHIMMGDKSSLQTVLQPYSDGFSAEEADEDDGALAQTAILQRAVKMTEDFAEQQGFLTKVEAKLERADLPLRAAEALFFAGAAALVLGVLGFVLGGLIMGLIVLLVAVVAPLGVLNFLARRRQKAFDAQLPDMLQLLSGSLRAGYSLMQGVEAVSEEVAEPMGKELRRVVTEARLGRDLDESLKAVAERMDSKDFEWAVMAVRIQREVGGNLAELLMTVADTMTNRERLRREVAALTAEGKVSAIVLACLPIGLGGFMFIANPEYMGPLLHKTLGNIMLGGAIVMMLVGFAWMKKVIKIEI